MPKPHHSVCSPCNVKQSRLWSRVNSGTLHVLPQCFPCTTQCLLRVYIFALPAQELCRQGPAVWLVFCSVSGRVRLCSRRSRDTCAPIQLPRVDYLHCVCGCGCACACSRCLSVVLTRKQPCVRGYESAYSLACVVTGDARTAPHPVLLVTSLVAMRPSRLGVCLRSELVLCVTMNSVDSGLPLGRLCGSPSGFGVQGLLPPRPLSPLHSFVV